MDKGNLSFTLDGKNLGVVSKDKRLLTGKWFSAILIQDVGDQVTLISPLRVAQA